MKSVLKQSRKVMGWKSRLMRLYFKSEDDTMKNEISATTCLWKNIYQMYWRVLLQTIYSLYIPLQFFNYKTVDRILDIVSVIYLSTRKIQ